MRIHVSYSLNEFAHVTTMKASSGLHCLEEPVFVSSCFQNWIIHNQDLGAELQTMICKGNKNVVLYGCETWSLTLREEHRPRVFENRVLRRIFGPKREEDGSWRKLHNDELHSLYSSLYIVRVIKAKKLRGGTCGTQGGGERCLQGFRWEARR
jgi:hypothetical protein